MLKKIILISFYLFLQILVAQETVLRVKVKPDNNIEAATPISISLENLPRKYLNMSLQVVEIRLNQKIPTTSQIVFGKSPVLWWILSKNNQIMPERTFELQISTQSQIPILGIAVDESGLEISKGKMKVLRYNYALTPVPPGVSKLYERSGYIHPIWTPMGKILTRIHASDHIHHMGFWNPWTKTVFEGRNVDFWNIGDAQGTVRFVRIESLNSGPIFASFRALQEHVDLTAEKGEKVALNEFWDVRVWNITETDKKLWIWDFTTTQKCATEHPLLIKKYRYGGFGFRGTSDWEKRNSNFLTSERKTREDGNGSRARWCNVYGQTDEGHGGIVFMGHPHNYEFPEPMRIWPDGDIFFGFCPVVYKDIEIVPREDFVRTYRMIVYDGILATDEIEKYWNVYVNPPQITVDWLSN
jgi:hypothetical protein